MALFKNTKSNKIFWGVGIFCVAVFLLLTGWNYYDQWKGEKQVEKLANALKQMREEIYNKKAADTIGGKTPQETLDLFIAAVEKGDYELASKYFVIEKQEEELKSLQNSKKEDIENAMGFLRKTILVDARKSFEESYDLYGPGYGSSQTKEEFVENMLKMYADKATMRTKLDSYDFDVDFILYPSGNWKIEEI